MCRWHTCRLPIWTFCASKLPNALFPWDIALLRSILRACEVLYVSQVFWCLRRPAWLENSWLQRHMQVNGISRTNTRARVVTVWRMYQRDVDCTASVWHRCKAKTNWDLNIWAHSRHRSQAMKGTDVTLKKIVQHTSSFNSKCKFKCKLARKHRESYQVRKVNEQLWVRPDCAWLLLSTWSSTWRMTLNFTRLNFVPKMIGLWMTPGLKC